MIHSAYNHFIEDRKEIPQLTPFSSWPGAMINSLWLELPVSRANFQGPKDALESHWNLTEYAIMRAEGPYRIGVQRRLRSACKLGQYGPGLVFLFTELFVTINPYIPADTWRLYNVASTSMQRHDVASTLRRRCINVMCPLGMPSALFYINSRDRSISNTRSFWLVLLLPCFKAIPDKMQTVMTLIRRRMLIWVYTVCQCPFYGSLGINGLNISMSRECFDQFWLECANIQANRSRSLRKHAYSNILQFYNQKRKFSDKKFWYFSYSCSPHRL